MLVSCGGGGGNSNVTTKYVYVANAESDTVSMYAINATTGLLTALSTPTVATGTQLQAIDSYETGYLTSGNCFKVFKWGLR